MADNMIELVASLNVDDSAEQINKVDIPLLQDKIKGIKIKCELDTDDISSIQSQLANIKINAPQIDLGVGGGSELINNVSHIVDNVEDKIEELRKNLAEKFGVSVDKIVTNTIKNAKGQINSFSFDLTKLSGEVEKFSYKVSRTKQKDKESGKDYTITSVKAIGSRDSDKGAIQLLERATKAANTLERQMINLKAAADDVSAPRPIASQESIDKVAQAYKNAETAVDNLRTANVSTFEELNNEAKKAVDELNNVIKAQRNADTAATKLRAKPIEVVKADELSNLDKFVATISNSAIPDVANLTRRVEELRSELSEVNDKQGLVDYLNKFANVESDFKALVAQAKAVKGALRDLDNLSNNALFQKNKSDPQVSSTLSDIEDIRKKYGQLFAEIGNAKTPEDLQKISNKLAELKPQFDKVTNSANQFKTALNLENIDAERANRIKRLTADINSYAVANKRAVESTKKMSSGKSFADEWSRITSVMAKGAELTDRELKDLSVDMAVFRKEAQAAELAGESAFGKFLNSFKTMSSYITANMVFNFVKRQIRDMVNEVTAIDTAMTELRKVTEATNTEFEAFTKSAGQTGRELGASISDVINATSTFSRAGFNLPDAEELGKVATLYKNVGDGITIDSASESIISIMKAFNIEAENSIGIIDRINEVSNRAAIDSGGLGLALQRVASAMEAANNSLDETIALTTVSNEIVQNPEMVSQGWRTVALRIRGAKSELEDAGLETEGMVESTAKLRDLIKGISGVDIMLDENTFKSTYQIIDELGRVWDKISDINQASLLEAIAGKRQSNIVAAALNNYERLDEILKISQQSAGSAMREQEEYAKSIQYSIDTLKAAYQDFADSVINSDFVKNLLGTAQSFLEVLTKIIDKFGTLPTILTSIATIGGIKGVGIFGNLDSGLSSIKGNIADVIDGFKTLKNYKDVTAIYEGFGINLRGLSQQDLSSLQQYVDLIRDANPSSVDLNEVMASTSEAAKNQAKQFKKLAEQYHQGVISENEYRIATQNLSAAQRIATVTSKALSIALNTIVNVGFMIAVNAIIKGIEYIATAEERAAEAAKELRENATSASAEFDTENKSLNELVTRYSELVSSTDDVASIKTQLSDLQDELVKKYGEEAEALDLLNGKYEENIEKMNEFARNNAKKYLDENKIAIEEAEAALTEVAKTTFENRNGMVGYYGGLRLGSFSKEFAEELKSEYDQITVVQEGLSKDLTVFVDGDLKTRLEIAKKIRSEYGETENYSKSLYQSINNTIQETETLYEQYKQIADEAKKSRDILSDKNVLSLENASTSIGTIATTAISQLAEINAEIDNVNAKWFENFGEMQKGSLKTIDTIKSALQTIASGDLLSSEDFWALAEIDTDKVLSGAQLINNQFKLSEEQLIQLKDTYIQKQIDVIKAENADLAVKKQQTDELIRQAELEVQSLGRRGLSNAAYRAEYEKANEELSKGKQISKGYGDSISRNNLLMQQLNSSLGNTVDKQKAATELAKKAQDDVNNYAKAMTTAVQNVIDGLNDEKEQLESEKELLNDQLDIYNEQKEAVEDIIDQYKSIIDVVQDVNEAEIDALEARQEAEEKAIQSKIDSLKEQHEKQEEGNSLSEKELDLRKKLADLEKAKNTKVKTYSEERGWHFDIDREVVANAQAEAVEAQKVYDKAVADRDYNNQIKALEAEKKAVTDSYQLQIDAQKTYFEQWQEIVNEQSKAESEQLAEQILGSEWREKIKNKDTEILNKYRSDFRLYNSQLNNLVNNEIASLQKSIKAKDEEIKAKSKQIESWQDYKNQVQDTIDTISGKYDEYVQLLNNINISESDSYDTRINKLSAFAAEFESLVDDLHGYQSQVDDINISVNISTGKARDDMAQFIEDYKEAVESMSQALEESSTGYGIVNSDWDARLAEAANRMKRGYATGGTVDYTGVAMVHGSKTSAETVFNAAQSKELYNMVKSGTFANVVADKAYAGLTSAMGKINNATNSDNRIININGMVIKADNPKQFHEQFMQEIGQYWNVKLTESYVR